MLGLFAIGVGFLHAPALAASLAVLLTMLAALTLLPAMLSKIGTRIDRLRVRRSKPAAPPRARAGRAGAVASSVARGSPRSPPAGC